MIEVVNTNDNFGESSLDTLVRTKLELYGDTVTASVIRTLTFLSNILVTYLHSIFRHGAWFLLKTKNPRIRLFHDFPIYKISIP